MFMITSGACGVLFCVGKSAVHVELFLCVQCTLCMHGMSAAGGVSAYDAFDHVFVNGCTEAKWLVEYMQCI